MPGCACEDALFLAEKNDWDELGGGADSEDFIARGSISILLQKSVARMRRGSIVRGRLGARMSGRCEGHRGRVSQVKFSQE